MVRYKARYLLFNVLYPTSAPDSINPAHIDFLAPSDSSVTPGELATLIREGLSHNFGDWGAGIAGNISVKYFSPATSTGIVRVSREQYRLVWAVLSYIREIKGRPCTIRVVHVSGTIKKAEIVAVKRAKLDMHLVA
ncbi:ribonucleases P/MRP protein subunit POP5, partial [Pyronema omphalodes]